MSNNAGCLLLAFSLNVLCYPILKRQRKLNAEKYHWVRSNFPTFEHETI